MLTFFKFVSSIKPNPVLKLKTAQEKIKSRQKRLAEKTSKILTQVLNNLQIYKAEELKDIFTTNYKTYEDHIIKTDYNMLVKSLLDDLEKNIHNVEEDEKIRTKRNAIAKESYTFLKKINSNLSKSSLDELQLIYEKSLELYKNYSKFTLFGVKINHSLSKLNDYINIVSNRRLIQENLSKVFLDKINNVIANVENYSVRYLTEVLEKSSDEYNNNYRSSKLNRNIELSLQSLSNTLTLLKILVSYIDNDLALTENERSLTRELLFNTYSQFFSLENSFLFKMNSKKSQRKIEKLFNLELERKLMLEEVNNKIITLDLSNNAYIKLLISNLVSTKDPQPKEDLKNIFTDLSQKISINNKEILNEVIVKLTELSNSIFPFRKKSLFELRTKLS